ncbi:hypothetical protein [Humibacter sp. RRB41]|uniref:hypothetical protein n=1 Tax=Humibacter sp. RRB41 TaxID=2919946 RepID=UPI001FA9923F|nr:hypothetical protein [Humibacter sp. RRB41]
MDIQNHYYGHSAALARAAGLDSVRHINGLIQHGWTVTSPNLAQFADFATLPKTARRLVWSHAARGWSAEDDSFETTAIGAPFLYLSALTAGAPSRRSAAVVFPVHGTRLVEVGSDDVAFAREIADREGPAVICVHPEDLDRPDKRAVWTKFGHTVVSAGARRDPEFLGRILALVRSAPRVVSNQLSTAILYAAAEGTEIAIYGSDASTGSLGTGVAERTRDLWPEFYADVDTERLRSIALAELGRDHLLDPAGLRAALGWEHRSPNPFLSYWISAPVRKAGAVLGLVGRPRGAKESSTASPPSAFLRHPLSHLPGRLPRLPAKGEPFPHPLTPPNER